MPYQQFQLFNGNNSQIHVSWTVSYQYLTNFKDFGLSGLEIGPRTSHSQSGPSYHYGSTKVNLDWELIIQETVHISKTIWRHTWGSPHNNSHFLALSPVTVAQPCLSVLTLCSFLHIFLYAHRWLSYCHVRLLYPAGISEITWLTLYLMCKFWDLQIQQPINKWCQKHGQMGIQLSDWVENIVEKGEIAHYEQVLLIPQCFQKLSSADASKWVSME